MEIPHKTGENKSVVKITLQIEGKEKPLTSWRYDEQTKLTKTKRMSVIDEIDEDLRREETATNADRFKGKKPSEMRSSGREIEAL